MEATNDFAILCTKRSGDSTPRMTATLLFCTGSADAAAATDDKGDGDDIIKRGGAAARLGDFFCGWITTIFPSVDGCT